MTDEELQEAIEQVKQWAYRTKIRVYQHNMPSLDELADTLLKERRRTDEETLIAYIRHNYTDYEALLAEARNRMPWWIASVPDEVCNILRARINRKIAKVLSEKVKQERH